MEQTLKITLTADNKQALKAMNDTVSSMQGVSVAAGKAGAAMKSQGSNFQNFGRVIQDLPFGFQGIQNNLTQLIPSVGFLGLAFSGIISAITFAQVGLSYWTRGAKKAKEETDKAAEAQKELSHQLNEAAGKAQTVGIKLQGYLAIARDETKTSKERNVALAEANKLYGDHNEKLTLTNINTEKVKAAVDGYTKSLIANAVAAKYGDQVADLIIKQADALDEVNKKEKERAAIVAQVRDPVKSGKDVVDVYGDLIQKNGELNKATSDYNTVTGQLFATMGRLTVKTEEAVRLQSLFGEIGEKSVGGIDKIMSDLQKTLVALNIEFEDAKTITEGAFEVGIVNAYNQAMNKLAEDGTQKAKASIAALRQELDAIQASYPQARALAGGNIIQQQRTPPPTITQPLLNPFASTGQVLNDQAEISKIKNQELLNALIKQQLTDMQSIAQITTNLIAPVFENMFNAFAEGQDVLQATLQSLKDMAKQLFSMVIRALLFQAIFKALAGSNPITAGLDLATGGLGGNGGLESIIRGQDLQLLLNRTGSGNQFRRGG